MTKEKQNNIEEELRETSRQLQSLMSSVPGGIGIFEQRGNNIVYRYFNDGLPALMDYTREEYMEVVKDSAMAVVYPEDLPVLIQKIQEVMVMEEENAANSCEIRMIKKDGTLFWVFLSAAIMSREPEGIVFSAVFNDIDDVVASKVEMEEKNRQLKYHVEHDLLTGLYNREKFCQKSDEFLQQHKDEKCLMLRVDIERFKVINELFGSEVGDNVLQKIAKVLEEEIGDQGVYGRLEADHFAVCVPQSLGDYQELLEILEDRFQTLALNYKINMYMGVYEITDDSLNTSQMCERANMALASVKGNGAMRCAVYHEDMRTSLVHEQFIINEMSRALEAGQFQFYLQPIFEAATGKPIGAEALVRWIHPERGVISPGDFIPLFERNGFVMKLDQYTLESVCKYLTQRIALGKPVVPISVNVSRINLYQPDLCQRFTQIVDRYHLKHDLIKFEITESAYFDDSEQLIQVIKSFKAHGFRVLMDDFGSGYSSLNMLKDAPVDILKIDMNFLEGFEAESRSGRVLEGIIRLAKDLEMFVVAEGVETQPQADFLKSVGCDWIQGYLYARPMPSKEFEVLLEGYSA